MKKSKKKSAFKDIRFYMILLYALLSIGFVIQVFTVNIIPMMYAIPIAIVILLLFMGMYALQYGKHVNRMNRVLGKLILIILSILLGIGNYYLFITGSVFSRMSGDNRKVTEVSIAVLKENSASEIKDLADKTFGKVTIGDLEYMDKAEKDVNEDVGKNIKTTSYKEYKSVTNDLYNGVIDAIILNEGTRSLYEDEKKDFDSKTKIIISYKYESETKDISKNVNNITKDAFNIYISGIDTYGTISTVSRSDVNMIASINPTKKQILLTSIPRDYYIPQACQGNQKDKLTHTGLSGVECTIGSVENFFGIDINYYARVNFSSVVDIVDALDGITIDNPHTFTTYKGIYFEEGTLTLDGAQALAYSRERKAFADGDRERGRSQMRVITGIIKKAISPTIITNYASIMNAVGSSFQTNLSSGEMSSLVKMQLSDKSGWTIHQISVSGKGLNGAWSPANGTYSWVMEPDIGTVNNAVDLIKKVIAGEDVSSLIDNVNAAAAAAG